MSEATPPSEPPHSLIAELGDAILLLENGAVCFANGRLGEWLGWTEEQLRGKQFEEFLDPESQRRFQRRCLQLREGRGRSARFDAHLVDHKAGRVLTVEMVLTLPDLAEPQRLIASLRDISEKTTTELERDLFTQLAINLASAVSLEDAARSAIAAVNDLFPWDSMVVATRRSGKAVFQVQACVDTVDGKKKDFPGFGVILPRTEWLERLRAGETMLLQRESQDDRPRLARFGDRSRPSQSYLFVPVMYRTRVVALLAVFSYSPEKFSQREGQWLRRAADLCAAPFQRCILEQQTAEFSALGQELSKATEARHVAQIIVDAADRLLGWDACAINSYDEAAHRVEGMLAYDVIDGHRQSTDVLFESTEPSEAQEKTLESGGFVLLREEGQDDFRERLRYFGDTTRASASIMHVPVRSGSRVVAFLSIHSYTHDAYDDMDLPVLQALADHCGGALERTRIERQLKRSEARFRTLLEAQHDVVIQLTSEGDVLYASPATESLLGLKPEDMLADSRLLFNAIKQHGPLEGRRAFRKALRDGSAEEIPLAPWKWKRKGSGEVVLETSIRSLPEEKDGLRSYLLTARDVTEREQLEAHRRALESQIQQTQKLESLGLLAGGIAHDFNNLLTGILGNAELALLDIPPDSMQEEPLRAIERAARRASDLTRQMLAYAGKGNYMARPIQLSQLLRDMSDLLQTILAEGISLVFDNEANLPYVEADAAQIRQVIMNLVGNASDAFEGNPGKIEIRTRRVDLVPKDFAQLLFAENLVQGPFVQLSVTDKGRGMSEETQERMFDPFFTRKPTGTVGGRGLGLAAVAGIIRSHRSAIRVTSAPGRGTEFSIFLPVSASEPDSGGPGMLPLAAKEQKGLIIVADDERIVRKVACGALARKGYHVLEASDGREALHLLETHGDSTDVLLLDIRMPRLDGRAAFQELRRFWEKLPVIVMTAYTEEQIDEVFAYSSNVWFLHKPFSPQTLQSLVSQITGKK